MAVFGFRSAPMKIVIRLLLTMLLLYILNTLFDQYFFLDGGLAAYIILGSILTLLNLLVRPVLHIILTPLSFFMGPLLIIAVNVGFLWLTERIVEKLDPNVIVLQMDQSWLGWLTVAVTLGVGNWVMREVLRG